MAATLVACGLDSRVRLFVQSSVPAHTELSYLLESTATYGEMRRMVQFKEKSHGQESTRLSLLTWASRGRTAPVSPSFRDEPDTIAAKVRRAVTDSDPVLTYEPDRRPGVANLKAAVAESLVETLRPVQKVYDELTADPAHLLARLRDGADAAAGIAVDTVADARTAMGLLDVS
jgi:tryptophanyl-tRNA synthetase